MTELQEYTPIFPARGHSLRVEVRQGEPWFVLSDACGILAIANSRDAATRLDPADVAQTDISSGGQRRRATIINESGLYDLIMRSDKPEARVFRRWVTSEVLPSIRKTGAYGVEKLGRRELALMVIEQEDRLAELAPKGEAFDAYLSADGSESMATVAKLLGTGQNRLFRVLRDSRVLISQAGVRFNTPYQEYVERGWFDIVAGVRERSSGDEEATYTTRVRPKGVEGIRKLLAKI